MDFIAFEFALVVAALILSLLAPRAFSSTFRRAEATLDKLARRRKLAVASVGLLALSLRLLIVLAKGVSEPCIHDEFSYLLAGDTFSKGRLTNPTHPMWVHFETFHVNHQPTYMSMYPPAQGMILAAGKVLGHPGIGVWLAAAALCAALTWMLQAWLPPTWALLGGFYSVLRLSLFGYWVSGYYGGLAPAWGGALALGATGYLMRKPTASMGVLFALGALVLANSRPYEGFVVCGVLAIALAWRFFTKTDGGAGVRRTVAAATVVLVLGGTWMAYYNWRVFGDPWTLPYKTNRAAYAVTPVFVWQSPSPQPVYRHAELRRFFLEWEFNHYKSSQAKGAALTRSVVIALLVWVYYIGPLMTVPLIIGASALFKLRKARLPLAILAICITAVSLLLFTTPHYFAPAAGALFVLIIFSIRATQVRLWRSRGCGLQFVRLMVLVSLISAGMRGVMWEANANLPPALAARAQLLNKLTALGGQHLVLVRYHSKHDPLHEVVYNEADINTAKIVWARAMGAAKDKELLDYFVDRKVWMFEPDCNPPQVRAHTAIIPLDMGISIPNSTAPQSTITEHVGYVR